LDQFSLSGIRGVTRSLSKSSATEQADWLEDYALFQALKIRYDGAYYLEWPTELVHPRAQSFGPGPGAISRIKSSKFVLLNSCWVAKRSGFRNMPELKAAPDWRSALFCFSDSSDVWANPELFLVR
jgi:4-alpha-glucanotransferase